jgi:hypothetical protein
VRGSLILEGDFMTQRDRTDLRNLLLLIIALCVGILIGMALAPFTPPDPDRRTRGKYKQPAAGRVIDIFEDMQGVG